MKKAIIALTLCIFTAFTAWADDTDYHYQSVSPSLYGYNATLTCQVKSGTDIVTNVEIAAFTTGDSPECRGTALVGDDGICYLTIYGQEEATLQLRVWDKTNNKEYIVNTFGFSIDDIKGTPDVPYIITLNQIRGDVNSDGSVDIQDVKLESEIILGTEPDRGGSDVNADGKTDIADIAEIIKIMTAK